MFFCNLIFAAVFLQFNFCCCFSSAIDYFISIIHGNFVFCILLQQSWFYFYILQFTVFCFTIFIFLYSVFNVSLLLQFLFLKFCIFYIAVIMYCCNFIFWCTVFCIYCLLYFRIYCSSFIFTVAVSVLLYKFPFYLLYYVLLHLI